MYTCIYICYNIVHRTTQHPMLIQSQCCLLQLSFTSTALCLNGASTPGPGPADEQKQQTITISIQLTVQQNSLRHTQSIHDNIQYDL